jgi:hypothetical protein
LDDCKEVYGIVEAAGAEFFDEINGPAAMLVTRETVPQAVLCRGERGGVVLRLVERTRPVQLGAVLAVPVFETLQIDSEC